MMRLGAPSGSSATPSHNVSCGKLPFYGFCFLSLLHLAHQQLIASDSPEIVGDS
jgi:hypothetical protein